MLSLGPDVPAVRATDSTLTPAVSILEFGAVGATKSERAGIVKLKSEIKQVGCSAWCCPGRGG